MDGYYWNFTACIRSNNRIEIASAIANILEQEEDCLLISELPCRSVDIKKLRNLNIKHRPPLLIIGLGIGRQGWTIIKTYPNDWLVLCAPAKERPRLSALAMQLQCDAFHYRVVRDLDGLLLEANSKGDFRFDSTKSPNFSLIEVSQSLHDAMQVNQEPEIIRKKAEYNAELNRQKKVGKINLQLLASMSDELREGDAERIDRALAKRIDFYQSYWQIYDLYYQVYANLKQLKEIKVHFLYFQLPNNYRRTLPIYEEQIEEYWDEKL